jgi:hypothetical protein
MKKIYLKSMIAGAVIAGLSQTALANELPVLGATQDTWTADDKENNYGSTGTFRIDTPKNRGFVQFDVSAIPPGHVIKKATLTLTASANKVGNIPDTFVQLLPGVSWDETAINGINDDALITAITDAGDARKVSYKGPGDGGIPVDGNAIFDVTSYITENGSYTFHVNIDDKDARTTKYFATTPANTTANRAPTLTIETEAGDGGGDVDTAAPVFPADIEAIAINATGVKTDISGSINITATDETDSDPIAASIVGDASLISGSHTVTLEASDAAGNVATKDITVNITPLITLTAPEDIISPVNASAFASVKLSGPAVAYPVTIDYEVNGDAAVAYVDTLTFSADDFADAQEIEIAISADALNDETAVLTLTEVVNVQATDETITITAKTGNIAPSVSLLLEQAGIELATINASNEILIPYIDATKGPVTVTATIKDFNAADTHSIDWEGSSESLSAQEKTFEFSPEALSGDFTLNILITETNTVDKFPASLTTKIKVIAAELPELSDKDSDGDTISDAEEGYMDSDGDGIVDYLDDNNDTTELPVADKQAPLKTLDGLHLSLGSVSSNGLDSNSAVITLDELADSFPQDSDTSDSGYFAIEGVNMLNFTLSGLTEGTAAPIIYSLPKGVEITENTEYRKYTPAAGWTTFVSDADNKIASAPRVDESCPGPNDATYVDGLKAGDACIQLTILDGGIYDADGSANGSIEDPGLLAESNAAPQWDTDTLQVEPVHLNENTDTIIEIDLAALASDADGDALTFTKVEGPDWVTIDANGAYSADLAGVSTGEYTTTISVTDTRGQSADIAVTLPANVNTAPLITIVELPAASQNVAYSASIAEQISDAEGDSYTVTKVDGPHWLAVSETGEISGTPRNADIGTTVVDIEVTDSKGAISTASLTVIVEESAVKASKAGSFSGALFTLLTLVSLRRRKQK